MNMRSRRGLAVYGLLLGLVLVVLVASIRWPRDDDVAPTEPFADTSARTGIGLTLGRTVTSDPRSSGRPGAVDYVWSATNPKPSEPALRGAHLDYYLAPTWNDARTEEQGRTLRWYQLNHPDWVAYRCDGEGKPTLTPAWYTDASGKRLNRVPLDVSNPQVRTYLAAEARTKLKEGFGGVAMDNVGFTNFQGVCGTYEWVKVQGKRSLRWKPLGYPAGANATNAKLQRDVLGYITAVRKVVDDSPGKTLAGNVNPVRAGLAMDKYLAPFDLILDEDGFMGPRQTRVTGRDWQSHVALAETAQKRGKAYVSVAYAVPGAQVLSPQAKSATINWVFANYLLIRHQKAYVYIHRLAPGFVDLPEYTWDLGRPTSGRYALASGKIQARRFERALVLVNPSNAAAVSLRVPDGYEYPDGRHASSVSLPPASGFVLRAAVR